MSKSEEKILLSYLPTGGGHIGAARAIKNALVELAPDANLELFIYNGINEKSPFQKNLLETGYLWASTKFPFFWPILYEVSRLPFLMDIQTMSMAQYSAKQMAKFIIDNKITKIVNLHFLLNRTIRDAKKIAGRTDIPVVTIVTDPFTLHPIWTHKNKHEIIVFTEEANKRVQANLDAQKLSSKRIRQFFPMINPKFDSIPSKEAQLEKKLALGFSQTRPLLLIAGGGEGLPGAEKLLKHLIKANPNIDIALVCGKNKAQKLSCEKLAQNHPFEAQDKEGLRVKIYGFVDFMYELMCASQIIAGKAGPATVFECIRLSKPLILTNYLYGQEHGNKNFVVREKLGLYAPTPKKFLIQLTKALKTKIENTSPIPHPAVQNGSRDIAKYILYELK